MASKRVVLKGPADREIYARLVQGFIEGKEKRGEDARNKDMVIAASRVKRALFAVGSIMELPLVMPVAQQDDPASIDRLTHVLKLTRDPGIYQFRLGYGIELKPGRQVLELTTVEWDTIEKNIGRCDWSNAVSDVIEELYERIAAGEPVKEKR